MTKTEKTAAIAELKEIFSNQEYFYITDYSSLTVEQINNLRRICFQEGVKLKVLKNTLVRKALEQVSETAYEGLYDSLHGPTAIMFSESSNLPARIIKDFRKTHEKPVLKAAYIDSDVFVGDDQVEVLSNLKSKDELIGEIIGLLQSPITNVVGALQSGGSTIMGVLKTLEEKGE
ncbi:MAG: 50S ribosomal protein L10 [Bacteroidota bacterium]